MSISAKLQPFANSTRITINDKFMGDQGAAQLAQFLNTNLRVQSLQIKSNDISPQGFILIFNALSKNQNLKDLNIQHNNLGINDYIQWHDQLSNMILACNKLQRLNLSNNKITGQGFGKLIYSIVNSKSLKLLEIRYNNISSQQIQQFTDELKKVNNDTLLFVELVGNKIKRQFIDKLQTILSQNRRKTPITKQKILSIAGYKQQNIQQQTSSKAFQRSSAIDQIPKQQMPKYLQDILDQTRRYAAQNKVRLQLQLSQLQKKQKLDAQQLAQLQNKCNQMVIINRNVKFQLDRTLAEHQQLQRDQDSHFRVHQQKLREGTKELQDLQLKYEEMESRMNKQHQMKMKQIMRDWQAKLRNVQQKIRNVQGQNNLLELDIKKHLQKRQHLKFQCVDQQNFVRNKILDQQAERFNFKMKNLDSKFREIEDSKNSHIVHNKQLIHELQKCENQGKKQIQQLQVQLMDLKAKQSEFTAKSKDFFLKNQKIKAQIQMKEITIAKLQDQIRRLNTQVQQSRSKEQQQLQKTRLNYEFSRVTKSEDKKTKLQKLNQLQNNLRHAQLQSAKLRQQYGLLAQKLQVNIGLAVHKVFTENSLY